MSDSLVVYRNPVEQAFWNSILDGGITWSILLPIVLIAVGFVIALYILESLGGRFPKLTWFYHWKHSNKRMVIAIFLGIFIGKLIKVFFLFIFPFFIEILMNF